MTPRGIARVRIAATFAILLAAGLAAVGAQARGEKDDAASASAPKQQAGFATLQGRWVRPDGGYVVYVTGVDDNGTLAATYANPRPLPFAVARAARENGAIKVYLELRAGGYNGSSYTLTYDPVRDVLKGVYYQANAGQSFDVYFVRKN